MFRYQFSNGIIMSSYLCKRLDFLALIKSNCYFFL
nr:MAG TPA: hypothetical protein [Bacteriophage sp.]